MKRAKKIYRIFGRRIYHDQLKEIVVHLIDYGPYMPSRDYRPMAYRPVRSRT